MKLVAALLLGLLCLPGVGRAGVFDLATFSCDSYENQILNPSLVGQSEDAVNFSMWLFGFAVGRSGGHSIYSNGLQTFGTALDDECKRRPTAALQDALKSIDPANSSPMDLKELDCSTFEARNADLAKSDPNSARTIRMWLYGFAVGAAGGRVLDTNGLDDFDNSITKQCTQHATGSLFDALTAARIRKKYR
jgi:HdeA/HdeB family